MSYSLTTLWHERHRYLPGVLAVAFSALLIAMQCGLLLGLFSITSIPIDRTRADVWMGAPNVLSVDLGRPIREGYLARLAGQPEVARCEVYLQGFAYWSKRSGGTELCMVIGSRLADDALGAVDRLSREQRALLTEPDAIIIDQSDKQRLGIRGVGDTAEVSGRRVKVVGFTTGLPSLAGPYVFCSINTARPLLRLLPDQITYVLARCHDEAQAKVVVDRLRQQYQSQSDADESRPSGAISAFTADEFSYRSRMHWLTKTKAGFALGFAAALGLLVGAVVTSQTLYAATAASLREFAVLRALGIPRWRMALMVLDQSFWVGVIGVSLALPAVLGLAALADRWGGVQVHLRWWLLAGSAAVTMGMALLSGLFALRSLRGVEPATLLR
jgi:putative ABC transport system permease protein